MKSALIGYTGFVGSNLLKQNKFNYLYNSKNISDIKGKSFDLVVCAGAPAEKWKINQNPGPDGDNLKNLQNNLSTVKAKNFILISTVDVYKNPNNKNESSKITTTGLHPYGLHRLMLEEFVRQNFNATIVRLPGLFGQGLKKNVIYDFLTNNNSFIKQIHSDSKYQYYNLDNIWKDIQIALKNNLKLINFATEPVSNEEVAREGFGIKFINKPKGVSPIGYNFKTKYSNLYNGSNGYLYNSKEILKEIKEFVDRWKKN